MSIFGRAVAISTALVALLAVFITRQLHEKRTDSPGLIRGRNETILFLALAESGQINVQLATAQALIEKYPNIKVHFASFPQASEKVARVSSFALKKTPSAHEMLFHELPGPDRI